MTTITADSVRVRVAEYLAAETEASAVNGRVTILTPIYNLERDAVVVWIDPNDDGSYDLSDAGEAVIGFLHEDECRLGAIFKLSAAEAGRAFDTAWSASGMAVVAHAVKEADLAEAVIRVAQASAHVNARVVAEFAPASPRRPH